MKDERIKPDELLSSTSFVGAFSPTLRRSLRPPLFLQERRKELALEESRLNKLLADNRAYCDALNWALLGLRHNLWPVAQDSPDTSILHLRSRAREGIDWQVKLRELSPEQRDAGYRDWREAHWFDFRAIPTGTNSDMADFGRDLVEKGIIELPFEECVFVSQYFHSDEDNLFDVCSLLRRNDKKLEMKAICFTPRDNRPPIISTTKPNIDEIYYYLAVMNTKYAITEILSARSRKNPDKFPSASIQYFVVRLDKSWSDSRLGGSHATPRLHWRRGHIRHLNDKPYWVRAHLVGSRERGVILHDYAHGEPQHNEISNLRD